MSLFTSWVLSSTLRSHEKALLVLMIVAVMPHG